MEDVADLGLRSIIDGGLIGIPFLISSCLSVLNLIVIIILRAFKLNSNLIILFGSLLHLVIQLLLEENRVPEDFSSPSEEVHPLQLREQNSFSFENILGILGEVSPALHQIIVYLITITFENLLKDFIFSGVLFINLCKFTINERDEFNHRFLSNLEVLGKLLKVAVHW